MTTIILKIELSIDDVYETEGEGWEWLKNDILLGYDRLTLESEEIGDIVGEVKVLEIVFFQNDESPVPLPVSELTNTTRLQLARELIAVLSHNGMMPENMMVDKGEAWRKWQAEEMTK